MRKSEKTLLAGVAALVLIAGTGLAAAQQGKGVSGGNGTDPGTSQSSSTSDHAQSATGGEGKSEGAGGMAAKGTQGAQQSAAEKGNNGDKDSHQSAEKGKPGKDINQSADKGDNARNRSAEETGETKFNRRAQRGNNGFDREDRSSATAQKRSRKSGINTAQQRENDIPKGLQGNASKPMQGEETENGRRRTSGDNIQLSEDQRTHIRETVIDGRSAPKVGHVDFDIRVGTRVPRTVHFASVPETLVRIQPEWRGYRYFVYEDEIVIVDPHDMSIVAVVSV